MPNQKGSVKDRLRSRYYFLRYKKAKKKQEKEFFKRKKKLEKERIKAEQIRMYGKSYNEFQVFGLTILGLVVGLFTPKGSTKKVTDELKIIEKSINQIVLKLEKDKEIWQVYQDIDNVYQKLENVKMNYKKRLIIDSFCPNQEKPLLKVIDKKQKELEVLNDVCRTKEQQQRKSMPITENQFPTKNEKELEPSLLQKSKPKYLQKEDNSSLTSVKKLRIDEPLMTVKKINTDLEEYDKEMLLLQNKIEETKDYSVLFDYEFKIKQLKIRIQELWENYDKLKEEYQLEELENILDIDIFDKYGLRKDDKKILARLEECKSLLKEIERKKVLLSEKKQITATEKEKREAEQTYKDEQIKMNEENKKRKENLDEKIDEFYLSNKMVLDHILKEKKTIDKIKRQLSNQSPLVRKRSIFFYTKRVTTSILNFGISFLPFRFFKNRFAGALVSGIMINNSLRTVRRIFTIKQQEIPYIYYQNLVSEIHSNQDYIHHLSLVCEDSLSQVAEIREYLTLHYSMIRDYDAELVSFYHELDKIELQLNSQIHELEEMHENYDILKNKIKVKNSYYGRY